MIAPTLTPRSFGQLARALTDLADRLQRDGADLDALAGVEQRSVELAELYVRCEPYLSPDAADLHVQLRDLALAVRSTANALTGATVAAAHAADRLRSAAGQLRVIAHQLVDLD